MGSMAASGAIGLIVGVFVSVPLLVVWENLVYERHPERKYPGDLENVMILILGALLSAAYALVLGSGIAGRHRSDTSIS